jgi:uncharacterized protein YgbK (DUF1537 family)
MSGHDLEAAIVADDLTGALDMAAPFASRGFATRLLLDIRHDTTDAETRVLTLTSSSRDLTAQAAAENIRSAIGAALARKPKILIKKIDSTLRGDVVTAILTALQASGRRHALIATAVPGHGRTMRGGEVFVNGLALRDNPLRFDGVALPAPAPLPELLRASGSEITVHSWRRGHTSPPDAAAGLHAYVADCESDDDLDRLARFALAHADSLLVVGASGLGAAIAKRISAGRPPNIASAGLAGDLSATSLFVIGSRTPASAEQIDRLREAGAREIVMPFSSVQQAADAIGIDLPRDVGPEVLVIRPAPALRPESSREIAAALGQAAAGLVRRFEVDAVVMSGGDTALAVFQALGVVQAVLLGELSPGVAIGTFPIDEMPVTFVTKSGGFGDRDALLRISRSLKHSE